VVWRWPIVVALATAWSSFAPLAQELELHLADGTRVRTRLLQFISSETSSPAEPVNLEVAEDLRVDGVVAVSRGTFVTGTIAKASPMQLPAWRWLGWPRPRPGRLTFTIESTRAVDGQTIRLRSSRARQRTMGIAVGARRPTLMRWAHEGIRFDAFVDGDYIVNSQKR
jgi:hypothetical protein